MSSSSHGDGDAVGQALPRHLVGQTGIFAPIANAQVELIRAGGADVDVIAPVQLLMRAQDSLRPGLRVGAVVHVGSQYAVRDGPVRGVGDFEAEPDVLPRGDDGVFHCERVADNAARVVNSLAGGRVILRPR